MSEVFAWEEYFRARDDDGVVHTVRAAGIKIWTCLGIGATRYWAETLDPVTCIVCVANAPLVDKEAAGG